MRRELRKVFLPWQQLFEVIAAENVVIFRSTSDGTKRRDVMCVVLLLLVVVFKKGLVEMLIHGHDLYTPAVIHNNNNTEELHHIHDGFSSKWRKRIRVVTKNKTCVCAALLTKLKAQQCGLLRLESPFSI